MPPGREIVRTMLTVLAVAAALYLLYRLAHVVALVGMAVFVAVALAPAVGLLARLRVPRAAAILAIYATGLVTFLVASAVMVPPLVGEINELANQAPAYVTKLSESDALREYHQRYGITDKLKT